MGVAARCFHCDQALPERGSSACIAGIERAMCCTGCAAAAQWIHDAGLEEFYRLRSAPAAKVDAVERDPTAWDHRAFLAAHAVPSAGMLQIAIAIEGLRCAACGWLIEHALRGCTGVVHAEVNAVTGRASLTWDPQQTRLSTIVTALTRLGYMPQLPGTDNATATSAERRILLKRLGVAGLGMMQAMMFSESLYFGSASMDASTREFFRWVCLLVASPVVFYSGAPFLRGAMTELRRRVIGMDTLVSSTVLLAYAASVLETVRGGPAVYYDSVVMFIFLLLATRYVERMARVRANAAVALLSRAQPALAWRVESAGTQRVAVDELQVGDRLWVPVGESVPADGRLVDARASFDETILTGEALAVDKRAGATVLAGSVCVAGPATVMVERVGADTTLNQIARLVERAQARRPKAVRSADRIAAVFALTVFALAALTAAMWWWLDPARALPAVLAVLAVSCPCALSLAMPAVLAAAQSRLTRGGVLILRPDALESLARIDHVIFDKTGTLTDGHCVMREIESLAELDAARCLAIAAALERGGAHPLARAFVTGDSGLVATSVRTEVGGGAEGTVDGRRYRLGSPVFAGAGFGDGDDGRVVLSTDGRVLARFQIEEQLREGASVVCDQLRAAGLTLELRSGDAAGAVARVAQAVGISHWSSRQLPTDKLAAARALQAQGHTVAMIGDGVNDAAVLAGADVSLALASGAALAHASADAVLLGVRLDGVVEVYRVARAARRLIAQNQAWAIAYNALALPLAMSGLLPPWLAAVGMSCSSLVVTLNALRIGVTPSATTAPITPADRTPGEAPRAPVSA